MMSTTSETRIVYDQTYLEDKCWPPRPVDPKRADDQYVFNKVCQGQHAYNYAYEIPEDLCIVGLHAGRSIVLKI